MVCSFHYGIRGASVNFTGMSFPAILPNREQSVTETQQRAVLTTGPCRRIHWYFVQSPEPSLAQSTTPGIKCALLQALFPRVVHRTHFPHSPDFVRKGWWKDPSSWLSKDYSPQKNTGRGQDTLNLGKLALGLLLVVI